MPSSGYTAISFTAGEQPTTAKWNLVGSNDASFNTGNGFNDGIIIPRHFASNAVNQSVVDWTTGTGKIWWQELARVTAAGGETTLDTGTFTARKYLRIMQTNIPLASYSAMGHYYNGDNASNYYYRISDNGAADTTGNYTGIPTDTGGSVLERVFTDCFVVNVAAQQKVTQFMSESDNGGGANIPRRRVGVTKWNNTAAQITRVQNYVNGTSFVAGSEIIVLGHD
jgi:hypothetical protein